MANDDFLDDRTIDTAENNYIEKVKTDKGKLNARRKLEEYMELKRLRELTDY